MFDLMVLAFQSDVTRICTFMYANEGSNRATRSSASPRGTTTSRTTAATPKSTTKLKKINRFHIEQFAYLLGKLRAIREGAARSLTTR